MPLSVVRTRNQRVVPLLLRPFDRGLVRIKGCVQRVIGLIFDDVFLIGPLPFGRASTYTFGMASLPFGAGTTSHHRQGSTAETTLSIGSIRPPERGPLLPRHSSGDQG